MRTTTRHFDFRTGLQTTALEQGPGAGQYSVFQNVRVDRGAAIRRAGMVRVAQVTGTSGPFCITFDGVNDVVTIPYDARVWQLHSMNAWTIEGLIQETDLSARRPIFLKGAVAGTHDAINIWRDSTSSGRLVAQIRDSAGTASTLSLTGIAANTVIAWMLTKNAAGTFTLWANGATTTGTAANGTLMTANVDVTVGTDATDFFKGTIDFIRLYNYAKTSQQDGWRRILNPNSRVVLADYVMELDGNSDVPDRSNYGLTATTLGSPVSNVASLARSPMPVQMIAGNLSRAGARQIVVVCGGRQREGTIS